MSAALRNCATSEVPQFRRLGRLSGLVGEWTGKPYCPREGLCAPWALLHELPRVRGGSGRFCGLRAPFPDRVHRGVDVHWWSYPFPRNTQQCLSVGRVQSRAARRLRRCTACTLDRFRPHSHDDRQLSPGEEIGSGEGSSSVWALAAVTRGVLVAEPSDDRVDVGALLFDQGASGLLSGGLFALAGEALCALLL